MRGDERGGRRRLLDGPNECSSHCKRRALLEGLELSGPFWHTIDSLHCDPLDALLACLDFRRGKPDRGMRHQPVLAGAAVRGLGEAEDAGVAGSARRATCEAVAGLGRRHCGSDPTSRGRPVPQLPVHAQPAPGLTERRREITKRAADLCRAKPPFAVVVREADRLRAQGVGDEEALARTLRRTRATARRRSRRATSPGGSCSCP